MKKPNSNSRTIRSGGQERRKKGPRRPCGTFEKSPGRPKKKVKRPPPKTRGKKDWKLGGGKGGLEGGETRWGGPRGRRFVKKRGGTAICEARGRPRKESEKLTGREWSKQLPAAGMGRRKTLMKVSRGKKRVKVICNNLTKKTLKQRRRKDGMTHGTEEKE